MNVILRHREAALALIIAAMVAGVGLYAPAFASLPNMAAVLNDTGILFMLVLAQMTSS